MIHNLIKLNTHEDKQSYVGKLIYLMDKLESDKDLLDKSWYVYCSSLCVISFPTEDSAQLDFIESELPHHGDGTLLVALITKELLDKKLKTFTVDDDLPFQVKNFLRNMGFHDVDGKLTLKLNR